MKTAMKTVVKWVKGISVLVIFVVLWWFLVNEVGFSKGFSFIVALGVTGLIMLAVAIIKKFTKAAAFLIFLAALILGGLYVWQGPEQLKKTAAEQAEALAKEEARKRAEEVAKAAGEVVEKGVETAKEATRKGKEWLEQQGKSGGGSGGEAAITSVPPNKTPDRTAEGGIILTTGSNILDLSSRKDLDLRKVYKIVMKKGVIAGGAKDVEVKVSENGSTFPPTFYLHPGYGYIQDMKSNYTLTLKPAPAAGQVYEFLLTEYNP